MQQHGAKLHSLLASCFCQRTSVKFQSVVNFFLRDQVSPWFSQKTFGDKKTSVSFTQPTDETSLRQSILMAEKEEWICLEVVYHQ